MPDGSLGAQLKCNSHAFTKPLVVRLLEDFLAFAGRAAADPDVRLSQAPPPPA